jgi:hypothetical protein
MNGPQRGIAVDRRQHLGVGVERQRIVPERDRALEVVGCLVRVPRCA